VAGTIVLGYDGSPGGQAALETALGLAQQFDDRLVVCFGVAPPTSVGEEYKEHKAAIEELARSHTAQAVERARAAGVDPEVALVPERPAQALADLAEERGARFIVVGTHGESAIRGALLGSVTHKLLAVARTPLVVVPSPGRQA
jgi:nucleotide-binding universal stress UspA family protein